MSTNDAVMWKLCSFDQLTSREVYLLAKLRVDVFVVEQTCAYAELDGQDLLEDTTHILALAPATGHQDLVAYARILAPRSAGFVAGKPSHAPAVPIGRVVVATSHRRQGLATMLMRQALHYCENTFADHDQVLAAQVDVEHFYAALGFKSCSNHYLEDGIAHVDMVRSAANTNRNVLA